MEVLYVVGNDLNIPDNSPLRYSLRSLDKYASGVDQVYVVGYPPAWLSSRVKTLRVSDVENGKHWNILECIKMAVKQFGLDHDFLYSSDDHFLIKDVDMDKFPYYAKGMMYTYYDYLAQKGKEPGKYQKAIIATRRMLDENGFETVMACCHRNTHMDGRYIDKVYDLCHRFKDYSQYGFEPSCVFNNLRQIDERVEYTMITQSQDTKVKSVEDIIEKKNLGDTFMSTTPAAELNHRVMAWMQNNYKEKSKWER